MLGSQFELQFTYVNNATAADAPSGCSTKNPYAIFRYRGSPGVTGISFLNSVGTLELYSCVGGGGFSSVCN
jgi:hypothetical protein